MLFLLFYLYDLFYVLAQYMEMLNYQLKSYLVKKCATYYTMVSQLVKKGIRF